MIADGPADDVLKAVVIALDEDEVPVWLGQWRASPGPLRERMETEIELAAVVRTHNDPRRRDEISRFRALVDAEAEFDDTFRRWLEPGAEGEGDAGYQ